MRHFAILLAVAVAAGLGLSAIVGHLTDRAHEARSAAVAPVLQQQATPQLTSPDPLDDELHGLNAAMNDYEAWRARHDKSARVVVEEPVTRPTNVDEDAVPNEFSDLLDTMTSAAAEQAYNAAYERLSADSDLAAGDADHENVSADQRAAYDLQGEGVAQQRRAERLRQARQAQSLRNQRDNR